jgi:hypothetical protein
MANVFSLRKAVMPQPEAVPRRPDDRASWPCRFCHSRDHVVITLRRSGTVVCFCAACEQGWCTDDRGNPRDY